MITKKELKKIFDEAGFLYQDKLAGIDLELALDNIMVSYQKPYHKYRIKRDRTGHIIGHLGMLEVRPKVWMGHHHCSLDHGVGKNLFLEFAGWVWETHGTEINVLLSYYHSNNSKLYRDLIKAVDDPNQCWEEKIGVIQTDYVKDVTYGLNLSQLHYENFNIPPKEHDKIIYNRWTFLCNKYTISRAFKYFTKG